MHVSATRDLTIYTTHLSDHRAARFACVAGRYPEREVLTGGLHPGGHYAISPDERYIVFDSERDGGMGLGDLYVCFREIDGSWSEAINLGDGVNSSDGEGIPHITPDGKYLFYTTHRDIYWVSTDFIDALRP
jgi:Tol biopolymer transport system component